MSVRSLGLYLGDPPFAAELTATVTMDAELEDLLLVELDATVTLDADLSAPKWAPPVIVINM